MQTLRERVLHELRQFKLGEGSEDIVGLGLVRALSVQGDRVSFVLEDRAALGVDLAGLRDRCRALLRQQDGVGTVDILLPGEAAQSSTAAAPDGPRPIDGVGHVILVGSGKGGVGKSTVTANLALGLAGRGLKVGVLDADLYGPSQHRIFGATGRPVSYDDTLIPIAAQGVKLMSMGVLSAPDEALIWRGPILHDTLTRLLFGVRWAPLDVLLIDLPPGTGDVPLSIVQQVEVDGVVLVSTPQDLSRLDLRRCMDLFRRTDTPLLGLIENMSTHICAQCGAEDQVFGAGLEPFAEAEGLRFLGRLPLNREIALRTDQGLSGDAPDLPEASGFGPITEALAGMLAQAG